jgi:hypothetical protein
MTEFKALGIIDTISAGFSTVNRRLWLISIPILLDIFLWLGPSVSIAPLATEALEAYERSLSGSGAQIDAGESEQLLEGARQTVETISGVNLLAVLAWQVPSLAIGSLRLIGPGTIELGSPLAFTLVAAALIAGSLLYAALFLGAVAEPVRGGHYSPEEFPGRLQSNGTGFLKYYALVGAVVVAGFLLATFVAALVSLISPALSSLIGALTVMAIFLATIYLFFVDEAIFLGDMGPIAALRSSVALVWRNYWGSLLIIVLVNGVLWGTHIAWRLLTGNALGALAAIVGNGYIATGLTASVMIYYRQRALGW